MPEFGFEVNNITGEPKDDFHFQHSSTAVKS